MIVDSYAELYGRMREIFLVPCNIIDTRVGKTRELLAFSFTLTNPRNRLAYHKDRHFNLPFVIFEFLCDVTGTNDARLTKAMNEKAAEYSDDGLTFYGAYGPRISPHLDIVLEKLQRYKNCRQAVITINNSKDMYAQTKDTPCTLSLQFLLRDNKLNLIVSMRSNDFFWGLQYDLFKFTLLQEVMAKELNVELGWYHHIAGSMHVYEYHWDMLDKIDKMEEVEMPSYNFHLCECFDTMRKVHALVDGADTALGNDFIRIIATKFYKDNEIPVPEWAYDFVK